MQHPNLHIQPLKNADGALGSLLPRGIAVVGENNLVGIPRHQARLLRRQGRAQGSHGAVKTGLVQRDDIDVAL